MRTLRLVPLLAALLAVGCDDSDPVRPDPGVATMEVGPADTTLVVGDTLRLIAYPKTAAGVLLGSVEIEWSSADPVRATVTPLGLHARIQALQAGTVSITAVGGGKSGMATVGIENPAPQADSLGPASAQAGTAELDVTVHGSGFVAASRVLWNGAELPTTFVNATTLRARAGAQALHDPGVAQVSVSTPAPGGGTSAVLLFTVAGGNEPPPPPPPPPALPRIDSLLPDSAPALSGVEITVRGTGFVANSGVFWNRSGRPTQYVSETELRFVLWPEDWMQAGTRLVEVFNPGAGWSNAVSFTIEHALVSVRIDAVNRHFWPGESSLLTAAGLDERGQPMQGKMVTWSSDDAAVATVDAAGRLIAGLVGTTTVRATIEGRVGTLSVQVLAPPAYDLLYQANVGGKPELAVYRPEGPGTTWRLLPGVHAEEPAVTRDGARIAFVGVDPAGNRDIYVVNRDGSGLVRLTTHPAVDDQPAWSPDGTKLAFRSRRDGWHDGFAGFSDIWVMNADGTGQQNLTGGVRIGMPYRERPAWTADGNRIAFSLGDSAMHPYTSSLVSVLPDGSGGRVVTAVAGVADTDPAFSPDGQLLAISRRQGTSAAQVMLLDAATGSPVLLHDPQPGTAPAWSADSKWVAFTAPDPNGVPALFVTKPHSQVRKLPVGNGTRPVWMVRP